MFFIDVLFFVVVVEVIIVVVVVIVVVAVVAVVVVSWFIGAKPRGIKFKFYLWVARKSQTRFWTSSKAKINSQKAFNSVSTTEKLSSKQESVESARLY